MESCQKMCQITPEKKNKNKHANQKNKHHRKSKAKIYQLFYQRGSCIFCQFLVMLSNKNASELFMESQHAKTQMLKHTEVEETA